MILTKTLHPPGGATAVLAATDTQLRGLGWYMLPLVLLSITLSQAVALFVNNIQRRYPVYWWTPDDLGKEKEQMDEEKQDQGRKTSSICSLRHVEDAEQKHKVVLGPGEILVPSNIMLDDKEIEALEAITQRLCRSIDNP